MSISCIISEINRNIGRKSRYFRSPSAFDNFVKESPSEYCHQGWHENINHIYINDHDNIMIFSSENIIIFLIFSMFSKHQRLLLLVTYLSNSETAQVSKLLDAAKY